MPRRRSVLAGVIAALAVALVPAAPGHAATRTCSTFSGAGGDVLRVYALRGVSCAKAVAAAKKFATGDAPAPWHCLTGTGQTLSRQGDRHGVRLRQPRPGPPAQARVRRRPGAHLRLRRSRLLEDEVLGIGRELHDLPADVTTKSKPV